MYIYKAHGTQIIPYMYISLTLKSQQASVGRVINAVQVICL